MAALRYVILANPAAGRLPVAEKRRSLRGAAGVLGAEICGLETRSPAGLADCAREAARSCDVLVVAGGDGTFSDVVNALDPGATPLAFLPLGSGNALRHALGQPRNLTAAAARIREGPIRRLDLVVCSGRRRALSASVGLEGRVTRLREEYLSRGKTGFQVYVRAALRGYRGLRRPAAASLVLDGIEHELGGLLSLMVVKHPFYGYGLKAVPRARLDDGHLHLLWTGAGIPGVLAAVASGFTVGNCTGCYRRGTRAELRLDRQLALQTDGTPAWTDDRFAFELLPGALRLKG